MEPEQYKEGINQNHDGYEREQVTTMLQSAKYLKMEKESQSDSNDDSISEKSMEYSFEQEDVTQTIGIVERERLFEKLHNVEKELTLMRINNENMKEDIREIKQLMQHLLISTLPTGYQSKSPTSKRRADDSISDDDNTADNESK
jgi:septation ring formation regulator EzrA